MDHDEPEWQRAADAGYELVAGIRGLQRRALVPIIAGVVLGFLGAGAHASGHWALFGLRHDGTYRVGVGTLALAFVLPSSPAMATAVVWYRLQRARLRRKWLKTAQEKYGLPRDVLEERAANIP